MNFNSYYHCVCMHLLCLIIMLSIHSSLSLFFCLSVRLYVCLFIFSSWSSFHLCLYIYIYIYIFYFISVLFCIYFSVYHYIFICKQSTYTCVSVCLHVSVYVCMFSCMFVGMHACMHACTVHIAHMHSYV